MYEALTSDECVSPYRLSSFQPITIANLCRQRPAWQKLHYWRNNSSLNSYFLLYRAFDTSLIEIHKEFHKVEFIPLTTCWIWKDLVISICNKTFHISILHSSTHILIETLYLTDFCYLLNFVNIFCNVGYTTWVSLEVGVYMNK